MLFQPPLEILFVRGAGSPAALRNTICKGAGSPAALTNDISKGG